MRFSVFGIPVHVQLGFWIMSGLMGLMGASADQPYLVVEWVAVVLVSILVHELGHAFAMMRHGLRPEIMLYSMGGLTSTQGMYRLTRGQRIFISFAGPLAGFVLGGLVIGLCFALPQLVVPPAASAGALEWTIYEAVDDLRWVNIAWGIVNLVPVLPLDGGHILEDALGPRREKLATTIALAVGGATTVLAYLMGFPMGAMILLYCTFTSYTRYRAAREDDRPAPAPKRPAAEELPPEVANELRKARAALADDRHEEAGTLAELVLSGSPPQQARIEALEIMAWAHLLQGRADDAARAIKAIQREGDPDLALLGAVLHAKNEPEAAREVLEAARAAGDDRKEVIGPLIQILIAQGEVARAAAIALDIIDTLSEEDARQMASIAFEQGAFGWAARISEALFERTGSPDDAYDGVRSRSLDGDLAGAVALLRRAVAAGFSDAARLWSDKALEKLRAGERSELETLLPRP